MCGTNSLENSSRFLLGQNNFFTFLRNPEMGECQILRTARSKVLQTNMNRWLSTTATIFLSRSPYLVSLGPSYVFWNTEFCKSMEINASRSHVEAIWYQLANRRLLSQVGRSQNYWWSKPDVMISFLQGSVVTYFSALQTDELQALSAAYQ